MPGRLRWPSLAPFATAWSDAATAGTLWDTGNGYPAATFCGGTPDLIEGVRVRLDESRLAEALRVLDAIEAEGVLYRRVVIDTSEGEAFSYEWIGRTERLPRLPGRWA